MALDRRVSNGARPARLTPADVTRLTRGIKFPVMNAVEQCFDSLPRLDAGVRTTELLDEETAFQPPPGTTIGIAIGSRGIDQLREVVLTTVRWAKRRSCVPVIIPAMGSHGGATPRGQVAVLHHYGIDAPSIGAEIRPSLEVEQLGVVDGRPVLWSREALAVDYLVVINRVKPHTAFRGDRESGITKMIAVGLGKQEGALQLHSFGDQKLATAIARFADVILGRCTKILGLALIENAYHEVCHLELVRAEDLANREPRLLKLAREQMPTIPVDPVDVLVVDRIGKDISGDGMDSNITGRFANPELHPSGFYSKMIVVLGLTPETDGNANGIGLADFTTESVVGQVDWRTTYMNALTFGGTPNAKTPIALSTRRGAVAMALRCAGATRRDARVIRIRDTAHVSRLLVSEATVGELPHGAVVATLPVGLLTPNPWGARLQSSS